jgi:hypothetical protein
MRASRCPECGAAAALSIDGVRLHALLPAYLRRTSIGLGIVFLGAVLCSLSAGTMSAVEYADPQWEEWMHYDGAGSSELFWNAAVVAAGFGVPGILAGWLIATARPPLVAQKLRSRGILRRSGLAIGLALAWFVVMELSGARGMDSPLVIGGIFAGLMMFYFSSLAYMCALAAWIPDPFFSRLVYAQCVVVLLIFVCMVAGILIGEGDFPNTNDRPVEMILNGDAGPPMICFAVVLYIGLWILYTFTTHQLWMHFRWALREGAAREAEAERLAAGES